jgi:hypothetical protein
MTALQIALLVLAALAWVTALWANGRVMKRARESEHRYWIVNPLAAWAGVQAPEFPLFLAALLVFMLSLFGFLALK